MPDMPFFSHEDTKKLNELIRSFGRSGGHFEHTYPDKEVAGGTIAICVSKPNRNYPVLQFWIGKDDPRISPDSKSEDIQVNVTIIEVVAVRSMPYAEVEFYGECREAKNRHSGFNTHVDIPGRDWSKAFSRDVDVTYRGVQYDGSEIAIGAETANRFCCQGRDMLTNHLSAILENRDRDLYGSSRGRSL